MIWNMFRKLTGRGSGTGSGPKLTIVGADRKPVQRPRPRATAPRLSGFPKLSRRNCAWVSEGAKNASFTRYRCTTCGVEAFSRDGKAPRQCKRGVDGGL